MILGLILFLYQSCAEASESISTHGMLITIEPIVGYDFVSESQPSPHTNAILTYGARATVGAKFLAGEGSYTKGSNHEAFISPLQTKIVDKENARLGLKSTHALGSLLAAVVRAGGQASRTNSVTSTSGVLSTSNGKWLIRPYVGAGLEINLASKLSLALEGSVVINDLSQPSQNDTQGTIGIQYHLDKH